MDQHDMSVQPLDQLNVLDLTNTSTEYPVLAECVARVEVDELKVDPNAAKTGHVLKLKLKVISEGLKLHDGEPAKPGHVFTEVVSITQTPDYDPRPALARIQECFWGEKGQYNWADLKGKWGDVRIRIDSKDEDKYGKRNRVASWLKKKADAVAPQL